LNKSDLYVFGIGGHAKCVAAICQRNNRLISGFISDSVDRPHFLGCPVFDWVSFGNRARSGNSRDWSIHVAVGSVNARKEICTRLEKRFGEILYETIVDQSAVVAPSANISGGVCIMSNSSIGPDVYLGKNCIINSNSVVSHDAQLDEFVTLAPSVSLGGGCRIGEGATLNIGVCVAPLLSIGSFSVMGAGAVVLNDVPMAQRWAGVPARILD
jgi:acetyltransferase EpsM